MASLVRRRVSWGRDIFDSARCSIVLPDVCEVRGAVHMGRSIKKPVFPVFCRNFAALKFFLLLASTDLFYNVRGTTTFREGYMKRMHCPLNGLRNISEFVCGGEVEEMPGVDASVRDWADYIFLENNMRGITREWWFHVPSSYWFIAERDTSTDETIRTYPVSKLYGSRD